jgi:hypothetical protein
MDGENTTIYGDGHSHARSIDSKSHESRNWIKANIAPVINLNLPTGWRVCGENLYAKHSIEYNNLDSYFYVFSIWDERNVCISWDSTKGYSELMDLQVVPELYRGPFDQKVVEGLILNEWKGNECEGFVIRAANEFHYDNFSQNTGKCVRENHVQTDEHWMYQKITKNKLR